MNEDPVSRAKIHLVDSQVREGEAEPEDIREILEYFCSAADELCTTVDGKRAPQPELLAYLKHSFLSFLNGSANSMDVALGVKRGKRGRRKASEEERLDWACMPSAPMGQI